MNERLQSRSVRIFLIVLAVVVIAGFVGGTIALWPRYKKDNASSSTSSTTSSSVPSSSSATTSGVTAPADLHAALGMSTGVQLYTSSPSDTDSQISGIASENAKWIRTAIRWDDIEPNDPNHDDWTQADRIVTDAQQHNISLIFNVTGTPAWASGTQTKSVAFPKDPKLYATFVAKVAARYRGRVPAYELGNEPNHLKSFASPDTNLYVQVLKAAYPAIKAADPNAIVLTAGVGGTTTKNGQVPGDVFVQQLYVDGGKNYFDGIAYHPYTYPESPSQELQTKDRGWSRMVNARQAMVDNGDANKQIWITEFGAPTNGPGGVSQAQQAAIMTDGYQLWKSYSWSGPFCWFDYQDKGTDSSTHKDWFGVVSSDGTPKQSAATYKSLATARYGTG